MSIKSINYMYILFNHRKNIIYIRKMYILNHRLYCCHLFEALKKAKGTAASVHIIDEAGLIINVIDILDSF